MIQDSRRKRIGALGEHIACRFLIKKGFVVIEQNYRKPWGEIDIIAEKDGQVRFIEVKTISREMFDNDSREMDYRPEELVDARKLKKVARTAALYMEVMRDTREYQIDVVGVIMTEDTRTAHCRLFEQVLEDNL